MKSYRDKIFEMVGQHSAGIVSGMLVDSLLALCTDIAEDLKLKSEARSKLEKEAENLGPACFFGANPNSRTAQYFNKLKEAASKKEPCEIKCTGFPNTDCECVWAMEKKVESPIALADKIVNQRSEERDREYGGFSSSMAKTAKIATELCSKEITTDDAFKILIALKLSRLGHSLKLDSFVDAIGYLEGLWNFKQKNK